VGLWVLWIPLLLAFALVLALAEEAGGRVRSPASESPRTAALSGRIGHSVRVRRYLPRALILILLAGLSYLIWSPRRHDQISFPLYFAIFGVPALVWLYTARWFEIRRRTTPASSG
jgi:hypothetical protein